MKKIKFYRRKGAREGKEKEREIEKFEQSSKFPLIRKAGKENES
jgi:hypothetical protein